MLTQEMLTQEIDIYNNLPYSQSILVNKDDL